MSDMNWPLYVPTKGRAGKIERAVLSLGPVLVVEPQEEAAYAEAYPVLPRFVLRDRDRGIAFARQSILTSCQARGIDWFWMLDDDVQAFWCLGAPAADGTREWGRVLARRALATVARRVVGRGQVAMCSLEFLRTSRAFPAVESWGSYCYTCVGLHAGLLRGVSYRADVVPKEDTDFCLQVLSRGLSTYRACELAIECPGMGTKPGGLQDVYRDRKSELASVRRMTKLWPGIVSPITRAGGAVGCRVDWAAARRRGGQDACRKV